MVEADKDRACSVSTEWSGVGETDAMRRDVTRAGSKQHASGPSIRRDFGCIPPLIRSLARRGWRSVFNFIPPRL